MSEIAPQEIYDHQNSLPDNAHSCRSAHRHIGTSRLYKALGWFFVRAGNFLLSRVRVMRNSVFLRAFNEKFGIDRSAAVMDTLTYAT